MNGCVPLPVWVTRKIEHFWGFCCSTISAGSKCWYCTAALMVAWVPTVFVQ